MQRSSDACCCCTDDYHAAEGGWTEATLTAPAAVSHVEYYPREGFLSRSAGGRFVGVVKGSLREVTLATMLKQFGYTTGHFGKWHLGTLSKQLSAKGPPRKPEMNYAPPW